MRHRLRGCGRRCLRKRDRLCAEPIATGRVAGDVGRSCGHRDANGLPPRPPASPRLGLGGSPRWRDRDQWPRLDFDRVRRRMRLPDCSGRVGRRSVAGGGRRPPRFGAHPGLTVPGEASRRLPHLGPSLTVPPPLPVARPLRVRRARGWWGRPTLIHHFAGYPTSLGVSIADRKGTFDLRVGATH